ncbi:hypothetical protein LC593_36745 [Nostoc sp. CHAB 5844]|nr:hypothetical protein [Nostoc sp. CHAB 5844]
MLIEVGEQTANFASDAEKEIRTPVRRLGKQLTKVGNSLGKAEEHEEIEEMLWLRLWMRLRVTQH